MDSNSEPTIICTNWYYNAHPHNYPIAKEKSLKASLSCTNPTVIVMLGGVQSAMSQ